MKVMNAPALVRWTVCLFSLVAVAGAQQQAPASNATNPNPGLVSMLTNQLNITPQQATGGAGAIFGLAKSRLSPADFSKVAAAVPGMDGFLKAAPAAPAAADASSPLSSMGAMAPSGLGGLTSVAGSFQKLGLSPEMVGQFVPVIEKYVSSKGGSGVASLLGGVLK